MDDKLYGIYEVLHDRDLCQNVTAFQRKWMKRKHNYLHVMGGKPTIGPLFNLHWACLKAGQPDVAQRVYSLMVDLVDQPDDDDAPPRRRSPAKSNHSLTMSA